MTRSRGAVFVLMLVAGVTAGCGKKIPAAATSPLGSAPAVMQPSTRPAAVENALAVPAPAPLTEDDLFGRKTLDELNAEAPLKTVFFALDEWVISDDARPVLQANAKWLTRWPSTRIAIEGHCDDLGTGEYNLALGERRATAVKNYLTSLGVSADRLMLVSKGEEAPVCHEQDESCRSQNRRGNFVFTAK